MYNITASVCFMILPKICEIHLSMKTILNKKLFAMAAGNHSLYEYSLPT